MASLATAIPSSVNISNTVMTDHLIRPVAAQKLVGRTDVGDAKIFIGFPQYVRGVLGQLPIERLAFVQCLGAFLDQGFKGQISLLQVAQRINLAILHQVIGNRDPAMDDLPVFSFKTIYQHQPRHLAREDVVRNRQMNVKEGCHDHDLVAQVLQRNIQHLDAKVPLNLREVLPGDLYPLVAVLDQKTAAPGVTAEVVAEERCQPIIARGI
jgi:hypothetical protein